MYEAVSEASWRERRMPDTTTLQGQHDRPAVSATQEQDSL